jgi:serine/threonine protein kinase
MVLSSIDLWQRIAAEGLASPMQCRGWAAELAKEMPAAETTDGLKLLQALIANGKLTNYQAKILAGQSDRPLRRGPWTILQKVKQPLWSEWLEVTEVDVTKGDPAPTWWVRWLATTELETLRNSAPSLPRGLQLSSVSHPALQAVAMPRLQSGELQLQVAPVRGKLLSELFHRDRATQDRPTQDRALQIISQVAEALASLHSANLVHGRVLPDRIYVEEDRVTLACDPIAWLTATPDPTAVGILGERLSGLSSVQFIAPEFIAPGQVPTLATDIYSLGATWYWLLVGVPPASGNNLQQIMAKQIEPSPELPADLQYPEPLARCLQHCLGKNIAARFPNAGALKLALNAAQVSLATGKKTALQIRPVQQTSLKPTAAHSKAIPQKLAPAGTVAQPTVVSTPAPKRVTAEVVPAVNPPQSTPAPTTIPAPQTKSTPTAAPTPTAEAVSPDPAIVPAPAETDAPVTTKISEANALAPASAAPTAESTTSTDSESLARKSLAHEPLAHEPLTSGPSPTPTSPLSSSPNPLTKPATSRAAAKSRQNKRRQRASNKWLLPVAGGCIFVMILLLLLKLSGALEPREPQADAGAKPSYTPPPSDAPTLVERDPRLDAFQLVAPSDDRLWAPPELPRPIPLDLLPPGGQFFVSIRPAELLKQPQRKALLAALDKQLTPLLEWVSQQAGEPLEGIEQATIAFYGASAPGTVPQVALRIQLTQPKSLSQLKAAWQNPAPTKSGNKELLLSNTSAFYIAAQPLTDGQGVTEFSRGPRELMTEVAELEGASGPLIPPMETLWQRSDRYSDLSLLVSSRYLFSEGRGLLAASPPRLTEQLKALLSSNTVAALVQSRLEPRWYIEAQVIGNADRDAPQLVSRLQSELVATPARIEAWFVEQSPHPHWRGLAIRFPQMLRTVTEYARFGIEDGVAIMNAYLPTEAAPNVLVSSWIALQPGATLTGDGGTAAMPTTAVDSLTIEEYLGRKIRLSFDQEPIEVALRMIGEEANADLPPGTPALRFVLDGDAFERAGITRNQPLRDFNMNDQSVRDALTEVAKRGNPVTTVKDTREADQRLLWVVTDDPESSGAFMISLTTREAATTAGIALPTEFAP